MNAKGIFGIKVSNEKSEIITDGYIEEVTFSGRMIGADAPEHYRTIVMLNTDVNSPNNLRVILHGL